VGSPEAPAAPYVFEHGIEVAVGNGNPPAGLGRLASQEPDSIYSGYTLSIVDQDGSSLNHRVVHLVDVPGPHAKKDLRVENDLGYCLRSTLYHLDRIIGMHVDMCRLFEEHHSDARRGNASGGARIHYEVDAFLGAARRVYDSISKVLWKHYVDLPGRWRSIRGLVESETELAKIPAEFAQLLKQSWDAVGVKLTDYRDVVMHNAPLAGDESIWMNRYGDRWGAKVGLPTDPTAKRAGFDNAQGKGIDALGYCHGVATHLVGLCEDMMALPAVEAHLVNPSPQN
jgi:hypothetical protein